MELEYLSSRLLRFQNALKAHGIAVALISNPKTFYYLTGHKPLLSVSPTRPWYLIAPATGDPIACVSSIGFDNIQSANPALSLKTWPSPSPNDKGLSTIVRVILDLTRSGDVVGLELGREMRAFMPVGDLDQFRRKLSQLKFADAADAIWETREIKDAVEIAAMRKAIAAAQFAFDKIGEVLVAGATEEDLARQFQQFALAGGADSVGYLACCSGPSGYSSLTRAASNRMLENHDIIGFDTGVIVGEMWCDFNRNFSIGPWNTDVLRAQNALRAAIHHASQFIREGANVSQLRKEMETFIQQAGFVPDQTGRWGHGVGLDFTEPPSITSADDAVLKKGMVITLEPLINLDGHGYPNARMLVYEDMFLVDKDGAEQLT